MAKFSCSVSPRILAERQTINILKQINILSIGTDRNYFDSLVQLAEYANKELNCGLKEVTQNQVVQYLIDRSELKSQSTINKDRLAIQTMLQNARVKDPLDSNSKLPLFKSDLEINTASRRYTEKQIEIISNHQTERFSFATQIAADAGLRAHELLTLQRIEERPPDNRDKHKEAKELKFSGRSGELYTTKGKGGLTREIMISKNLADKLEQHRLQEPIKVVDRKINYQQYYDIAGGKKWTDSFSKASERTLGWSNGAHGLRHSYAQQRMKELQKNQPFKMALAVVSQELGHFRPEVTLVYLR
jgi:integrase